MTRKRWLLALVLLAGLTGMAYVAQNAATAGDKMTVAAEIFLDSLKDEQKKKAVYDFNSKERTNWHFVPLQDKSGKYTRKGLPLEEMTTEQREAATALVKAGTSDTGLNKALTIMSLESILNNLEKPKGGSMVRRPGWYFFTIFGKPSKTDKWGWRVEGHHLSLNFTIDKGKVASATPFFFGANPATVMGGEKKGLRTLPEAEEHAKALFDTLDEDQKKVAFQAKRFREIGQEDTAPDVGDPVGLAAAKMNEKQRAILRKLIEGYADRMPPDVAAMEMARVKEAGIDKVHFAFAPEDKPGKPYTYRVQGPTFVIEFLNVQADSAGNPANHIHSAWRNVQGDFGLAKK